jgi:Tol biopolymer transport system component
MSLKISLATILLSISFLSFAQEDIKMILTRKYAENSFRDGDYEFALENYLILYKQNKQDININYKIGICYTETTIDKSKAIPYLEFVSSHNNFPIKTYYYLGRSYMYNYRFTQAVDAFYDYKMSGVDEDIIEESDRLIQMCYDALERINVPRNVTFELLDSTVNTPFNEYYPFVNSENTSLLFTSDKTYIEEYEDYIANVFYSNNSKGKWSKAISLSTNTYDKDEIVGMTPDGEKILIYTDGDYSTKDIKLVNKKGSRFSNLSKNNFLDSINTEGVEMGACLSPDGNILYFASDRKGGRGGLDIYSIKKDKEGNWSSPENLGSTINTIYDENFPSLSINGKKMYFASKGHSGIGEYDIYESSYIDSLQMWTTPLNLGSPINTPEDNTTISFTEDGSAYIAANRKEGYGKLDIYKLTFGDENKSVIVMVTVMVGTEANAVPYSEDFLKAYGTFYDKYGNVIAQLPVESEGNFFGTLFPGTYKLDVRFEGYKKGYVETIEITEDKVGDFISRTVYIKQ